jgi:hypothetical protein
MSIWLQAFLVVALFWVLAAAIARATDFVRLHHLLLAAVLLLVGALILQAAGVRAAGWAALFLTLSLVVGQAAFLFLREKAAPPEDGST